MLAGSFSCEHKVGANQNEDEENNNDLDLSSF